MADTTTGPAPLPADALWEALRPFGASRMLPAAAYTDGDVFAWEQRHFFAGSWWCAGRLGDLSERGNQHAVTVGGIGVLLVVQDGRARAFANVCRHRGHELLPDGHSAGRRAVLCPYHGWAYDLAGGLRSAPRMGEGFDGRGFGLVELPLVDWHGWLFVDADADAGDFAAHLGDLDRLVAPYRPERLVTRARHAYAVAANWKVIAENYHECYHCPMIHPELCAVTPPDSGENWHEPGMWLGGSMALREHAQTMSLDGRSGAAPLPGVDPRGVLYLGVFPNLLVSLHPDYVMTHRMVPLSAGTTRVECTWLFEAGVADPSYAVDFWDLTNRQDWAACESVQRGLSSPHHRPGPLAPGESAIYDWVTMLARAYLDPVAGLGRAAPAAGGDAAGRADRPVPTPVRGVAVHPGKRTAVAHMSRARRRSARGVEEMDDQQTPRTDRPPGGVDLPLPGIKTARDIEDAREHLVDADADMEAHELHAAGRTCARCGRAIGPDDDVRRTAAGDYQHDFCPVPSR